MLRAIYPGSFDPVTFGHIDIIERASHVVDELIVGVLQNNAKSPLFSVKERVIMLRTVTKNLKNVKIIPFEGLLVDFAKQMDAKMIVNTWSQEELRRILYTYGEERYAPQIAAGICRRRAVAPIETTLELVDCIRASMPPAALREKQHPAKRSFQAIRIAVNDELGAVEKIMEDAVSLLKPNGRLAIITFHSLEDRIVKNGMAEAAKGCVCPSNFPVCVCGKKPLVEIISRKPITASEEELEANPRARSAKLRVCRKI